MVADRTLVTELATALGTLPCPDLGAALASRSSAVRIDQTTWDHLDELAAVPAFARDFATAYGNGRVFARAADGLAGRAPRIVEWTGGRRPSGDEVAPIDLRVDHVYLVSCKYLSANIANPSPARLFDGLLATTGTWDRTDWFQAVAPEEYQALYAACLRATGLVGLPDAASALSSGDREQLRRALTQREYPAEARDDYGRLCAAVSSRSAERWRASLDAIDPELMIWRLLRIGGAPYFLLGAHGAASLRLRVDTTWDWHHAYRLKALTVTAAHSGQPRVDWSAQYACRSGAAVRRVDGHVEIRWSHGRFGQPPEAKVYLDTPVDQVPGYNALEAGGHRGAGAERDAPADDAGAADVGAADGRAQQLPML
ncbi:MAG: hypothetical protein ACRDWE_14340 [Acidimicrobiales bacterium]